MTLVAVLLVLAAAGDTPPLKKPSAAKGASQYTGTRLEQGQKAFAAGDFKVALEALDAAVGEAPDPATLEKVQLLRAQALTATQQFSRAEEACAAALDANPEASLDPSKVDPSLVKMLDAMRARMSGSLVIRSTPPGARISLDGNPAGVAPLTVTSLIGRHRIEATWEDGSPQQLEVVVRNKRETFIEWSRAPGPAQVKQLECPAVPEEKPSLVRPFGDLRGMLDTLGNTVAPEGGLEVGAGVELPYSRVGLYARFATQFHLIPRVSLVVPLLKRPDSLWSFDAFLEVEVPFMFRTAGRAIGVGAAGGIEWKPTKWIGPFVQVGGRYLFINEGNNVDARFTFAGGVRLRLP